MSGSARGDSFGAVFSFTATASDEWGRGKPGQKAGQARPNPPQASLEAASERGRRGVGACWSPWSRRGAEGDPRAIGEEARLGCRGVVAPGVPERPGAPRKGAFE